MYKGAIHPPEHTTEPQAAAELRQQGITIGRWNEYHRAFADCRIPEDLIEWLRAHGYSYSIIHERHTHEDA